MARLIDEPAKILFNLIKNYTIIIVWIKFAFEMKHSFVSGSRGFNDAQAIITPNELTENPKIEKSSGYMFRGPAYAKRLVPANSGEVRFSAAEKTAGSWRRDRNRFRPRRGRRGSRRSS